MRQFAQLFVVALLALTTGFVHAEIIRGTDIFGRRVLVGDSGNNRLAGTSGKDFISGSTGSDYIRGFGGDDNLAGGQRYVPPFPANPNCAVPTCNVDLTEQSDPAFLCRVWCHTPDVVPADRDMDIIEGGAGNDLIRFGPRDVVSGGTGRDKFYLYWSAGVIQMTDFAQIRDLNVGDVFYTYFPSTWHTYESYTHLGVPGTMLKIRGVPAIFFHRRTAAQVTAAFVDAAVSSGLNG